MPVNVTKALKWNSSGSSSGFSANEVEHLVSTMLTELSSFNNKYNVDFLSLRAKKAWWSTQNAALPDLWDSISAMPWVLINTAVSELRQSHEYAEND